MRFTYEMLYNMLCVDRCFWGDLYCFLRGFLHKIFRREFRKTVPDMWVSM